MGLCEAAALCLAQSAKILEKGLVMKRALLCIIFFFSLISQLAVGDNLSIPAPLQPWSDWLKDQHPDWNCASMNQSFECAWPGKLSLEIKPEGGHFVLFVEVLAESELPLPSSVEYRPAELEIARLDGKPVEHSLLERDSLLFAKLPAGKYKITGSLRWDKEPREIPVPGSYAIIDVTRKGELKRGTNTIWFDTSENSDTSNSFFVDVARAVSDGSPLKIETRIRIQVSGATRSMNFGKVLLEGSVPIAITSGLPHQLSVDGKLALQVSPGVHEIRITAVVAQPVRSLRTPKPDISSWPAQETWAWFPTESFRTVEIHDATPASGELTSLPEEWKHSSVYLVPSGSEVTLKEIRRGEDRPNANALSLGRELWLDLDGSAFTSVDKFSGAMNKTFRLDALPETNLGSVTVDSEPALITTSEDGAKKGVELRGQQLNVEAVSRINHTRTISAVGWTESVDSLYGTLHLAPAWKLLHISGAHAVTGSWLSSWTLLDVFISLLLILAAWKVLGPIFSLLVAAAAITCHSEFLDPQLLFVHLLIGIVFRAIVKDVDNWLKTFVEVFCGITFVAWLIEVLTFSKLQLTQLLFPQLESGTRYRTVLQDFFLTIESNFLVWPLLFIFLAFLAWGLTVIIRSGSIFRAIARTIGIGIGSLFLLGFLITLFTFFAAKSVRSNYGAGPSTHLEAQIGLQQTVVSSGAVNYNSIMRKAPQVEEDQAGKASKAVQSGPARPVWRWKMFQFYFSGPVHPDTQLHFYLLPPWATRFLCLVRVIILLALAGLMFAKLGYQVRLRSIGALAPAVLLLFVFVQGASAEFPSPELLSQLEKRMEEKQCRREFCTVVKKLEIYLERDKFRVVEQITSEGTSAVALPGPADLFKVRSVTLSHVPTDALRRDAQGYLWVKVPDGESIIEATGELSKISVFTLQFLEAPLFTEFHSGDWAVEGLLPSGVIKGALRLVPSEGAAAVKEEVVLPSWFLITREFSLGDENRARTTVSRLGDVSQSATARVSLLPYEKITSRYLTLEGDYAVVRFSSGEQSLFFESTLGEVKNLKLVAHANPNSSEEWKVSCSNLVRCQFQGILPVQSVTDGKQLVVWKPFPEEEASVDVRSLNSAGGELVTVDTTGHLIIWGASLLNGELSARIRNSQQQSFSLTSPSGAEIKSATLDGVASRVIVKGSEASFLLTPGTHSLSVSYSLPWSPSVFERAPKAQISAPVHNLAVRIKPSVDRWLLWTGGPSWGPAVLFWTKLILVICLTAFLSSLRLVPFGRLQGAILGIGLATLPVILIGVPLLWLFVLRYGRNISGMVPRYRFLKTAVFLMLTLITLALFYGIVQEGLLLQPPMLVVGNSSTSYSLNWFVDHLGTELAQPWVISLPMWCWRAVMLVWSTWLAAMVIIWLSMSVHLTRELGKKE